MSQKVGTDSIDNLLDEARELLRRDPRSAMTLMRTVVVNSMASPLQSVIAHLILSRAHIHAGEYEAGEPVARNALVRAREQGFRKEEGLSHNEVGIHRFVAGDYSSALQHYEAAEHLLLETNDDENLAKVYLNVGNVYNRSFNQVRSISFYEKALALAKKTDDVLTQAKVHANLSGLYYHIIFDPALAENHAARALEIYRTLNDKVGIAKGLVSSAMHLLALERTDEALQAYEESLRIREAFSEPEDLVMTYDGLVVALIRLDRIDEAITRAAEIEKLLTSISSQKVSPYLQIIRARVLLATEKFADAAAMLRTVLTETKEKEDREFYVIGRELLSTAAFQEGSFEEAATITFEILAEHKAELREQAQQILARIKVELDVAKADARGEVEKHRNAELARMLEDLEAVHRENEEYVAVLAHELKSPLSTIRSLAGMMSSSDELSISERQDFNREIHTISTRMFDMIGQTLDAASKRSRVATPIVDACAVWEYVLRSCTKAAEAKGVIMQTNLAAGPLMVRATEQQLSLILDNLCSNAIKFSTIGAMVNATVIHQRYGIGTDRVLIRVKDQGPGISHGDQERLFKPFEQLSAQPTAGEVSTGLGLHLVKKTVEILHGRVWCESMEGKGATFFVELPIHGSDTES